MGGGARRDSGGGKREGSAQTLLRLEWAEGRGWGPRRMGPVGKSVGGTMRLHGRRGDSLFFLCQKHVRTLPDGGMRQRLGVAGWTLLGV